MSTIKIGSKRIGENTQIRTLIAHPMEHGRNRDKDSNELIPAHFIQELVLLHNDQQVASIAVGAGIAKDPYFAFMLKGGVTGDKVTISWTDNQGKTDSLEHRIK